MLNYINDLINRLRKQEKGIFNEELLETVKVSITEGRFDEALSKLKEIEKLPDVTEEIKLSCQILRSSVLHDTSKYEEGLAIAKETLEKSQELGNDLLVLDSLIALNDHLYRLGRFDEGIELTIQAEELIIKLKKSYSDKYLYERDFNLNNRKGAFLHGKGLIDQAIKQFKKCNAIGEKFKDKALISSSLNNLGLSYFHFGEMEKALDCLQKNLFILESRKDVVSLGLTLNNIARVYTFLGELDVALGFLKRGLEVHEQTGNELFQAASLFYMGEAYQKKGHFKQSYQNYTESLKLRTKIGNEVDMSEALFVLIALINEFNTNLDDCQKYFDKLKEINERKENPIIKLRTRLAEALILRRSDRSIQKAQAQVIFQEIANDEVVDYHLTIFSMFRLFELLLYELKASENEEVLNELKDLSEKILTIVEKNKSYPLQAEIYLLQSKLALLEFDLEKAYESLDQALATSEEKGLKYLVEKISLEKESLEHELNKWEDLTKRKGSIQERIDLADISNNIGFSSDTISKKTNEYKKKAFNKEENQLNLFVYCFGDKGIQLFLNSGMKLLTEAEEKRLGTFLSISVALGSEYYTGLYGPLPVTGHPQYETLVYAEMLHDSSISDERLEGKNYVILSIVYNKIIADRLIVQRNDVDAILKKRITDDIDINDISTKTLKEIEDEILQLISK